MSIVGLPVGALDPAQPARLLSSPGSKLSFATFHPLTASCGLQRAQLRGDELCSKKRVVIETLPAGESFWRWIPRAKGMENADDEGEWPRVVDICGQLVMCSQDQWDIHKLDPEYDCTVQPAPTLSTITRRSSKTTNGAPQTLPAKAKRPYVEDSSDEDLPMPGNIKKKRHAPVEQEAEGDNGYDDDFSDSDEEVEMMVENVASFTAAREARRKRTEENRRKRREKLATTKTKQTQSPNEVQDLSMLDLTITDTQPTEETQPSPYSNPSYASQLPLHTSQPPHTGTGHPTNTAEDYTGGTRPNKRQRRSAHSNSDVIFIIGLEAVGSQMSDSPPAGDGSSNPPVFKRTRDTQDVPPSKRPRHTQSPSSMRQEYAKKKSGHERFKQGKYNERLEKMRQERERIFAETLRAEMPPGWRSTGSSTSSTTNEPLPEEDPISLEEKIRRMKEINEYERERREREEAQRRAEAAEAEKKYKQEEALRREREKTERLRQERERKEEQRWKQQQEEKEQRRRQQEGEQRRQQEERYSYGPWTTQRALERYKTLAEAFDAVQFSLENPVSFGAVPWPVLHKPSRFTVEDVDWTAVEAFFAAVRTHMRAADYKTFVEKGHRRFHPDRWRARRVLQSVEDDELRACLEVAANTVAQAITPLWREVKST
ncbi:uncharacterized protein PHACADRAFT_196902 [Phanerochaete carnosa HHB-10118-sp]|uniref:Uncharacterized protein n=1 Tax=Phanerochaete carnosa (strain HHB-10118-sp) TaxID=650164 RepID=K5WVJ8_PHACS|nr:uncharacterized protein PHACADRAFT_196902 [Phanerochaete carnosa HHB-10118-sp]EKM54472.1 hypothetical protein PHACADRAFT_196902 [Phanerochaete carnosa HHB-10118-sp]